MLLLKKEAVAHSQRIAFGVSAPHARERYLEEHGCVRFTEDELRRECPLPVLEHVLSFHDSIGAGATRVVPVNACGTVAMDASWFLNHADELHAVNMEPYLPEVEGRAAPFYAYRTTRKVRAGEELLLDYRTALPSVWERVLAQRQENALSRQS